MLDPELVKGPWTKEEDERVGSRRTGVNVIHRIKPSPAYKTTHITTLRSNLDLRWDSIPT